MEVPPFSDQEKRFILAEAIKTSAIPIENLLALLQNVDPVWNHMLLPHGRTVQSCMDAYSALRHGHAHPIMQTHSFQSVTMVNPAPPPSKRKSGPEALDASAAGPASKRRQSGPENLIIQARDIRPKPSNGSPGVGPSQQQSQPKKRGRPSKADVELRQAEAIRRGDILPPPRVLTPKIERDRQLGGEDVRTPGGYAVIAPLISPGRPGVQSTFETRPFENPVSPGKKSVKRPKPAPKAAKAGEPSGGSRVDPEPAKAPKPGEGSFSVTASQPALPEKVVVETVVPVPQDSAPTTQAEASNPPQPTSIPLQVQTQPPAEPQSRPDK